MLEHLETRRLMSVTVSKLDGVLIVLGDSGANGIDVKKIDSNIVVREYKGAGVGYQKIYETTSSSVEDIRVYGYDGPDTISVDRLLPQPAKIMGGRGADWLKAGGGQTYVWGHGDWAADPTGSHNPATDDNAADTLITGNGYKGAILRGQGGNDTLVLNSDRKVGYPDIAWGDAGNDTFDVGGKNDLILRGNAGNDFFRIRAQNPRVNIGGDSGSDTVEYIDFGQAVYATNDGIQKSGPLAAQSDRKQLIDATVEAIYGTNFADNISNKSPTGIVYGRGGNDSLFGGSGRDLIDGGTGNDFIYAGGNHDSVLGQDGNDTIYGDSGNDVLTGGNGSDVIYGLDGNDTLYGQAGSDFLYGGSGNNLLVGGTGSDYLYAKNGTWFDVVIGDNLDGTGGSDDYDVAVIDSIFYQGTQRLDLFGGFESVVAL